MIAGRLFVTPHAVRRYRERCRPGIGYEQALGELIRMAKGAHRIRAIEAGCELWRSNAATGRRRLIVGYEHEGAPQLVTVLPFGAAQGS